MGGGATADPPGAGHERCNDLGCRGGDLCGNGGTALLFASGRGRQLNINSASAHGRRYACYRGVAAAGIVIAITGWMHLDPVISLVVSAVIVVGTWGLLKSAVSLALDAMPKGIDATAVRVHLAGLPGGIALHDLYIWGMARPTRR